MTASPPPRRLHQHSTGDSGTKRMKLNTVLVSVPGRRGRGGGASGRLSTHFMPWTSEVISCGVPLNPPLAAGAGAGVGRELLGVQKLKADDEGVETWRPGGERGGAPIWPRSVNHIGVKINCCRIPVGDSCFVNVKPAGPLASADSVVTQFPGSLSLGTRGTT